MSTEKLVARPRLGFFCALAAQFIWGGFPLFYSQLKSINSFELVAHRAIWAFLVVSMVLVAIKLIPSANKKPILELISVLRTPKTFGLIAIGAFLVGINWLVFVWAVTHNQALEASLGYYICPQVNVLLGVLILGERLKPMQWMAVGLAACGVIYISSFSDGVPWIAIAMASSFGMYGLVKKKIPVSAIPGLTVETGILIVPAIIWLAYRSSVLGEPLIQERWTLNALLIVSGLMTVTPLAFYATALRHIPLSTAGLLQFIGPSLQFFSGVYLLGEPFDRARLVGFIFVWLGLALFLASSRRKVGSLPAIAE